MDKKYLKIVIVILVILSISFLVYIININKKMNFNKQDLQKDYTFGDAYFLGDVNGNNKLDAVDYKYVVRYLVGTMTFNNNQKNAADIDKNGSIDARDYKMIVRKIVSGDIYPPATPTPKPTITPTPVPAYACYYKDSSPWQYIWTNNPPSGYVKENKSQSECVNACYCHNTLGLCGIYAKGKAWEGWSYISDTTNPSECKKPAPSYDITSDSKYNNYTVKASCESSTMKYKIVVNNGEYYTLIWVANPASQFGVALANGDYGIAPATSILKGKFASNACAVAVNGSFFNKYKKTIVGGVVINNGRIIKDDGNAQGLIGMNTSGYLGEYSIRNATDILNAAVINTVGISSQTSIDKSTDKTGRTQICQVDSNNFALFTGSGTVSGCGKKVSNFIGCSTVYNLDGGSSRRLFYQTKTSGLVTVINGSTEIFDMVYFSE